MMETNQRPWFISDPSKGYKGISAFIVEKEWGVEIAKKEKKVGLLYFFT